MSELLKTCANCKHYRNHFDWSELLECLNRDVLNLIEADAYAVLSFEPPPDFGCNKWEAK